MSADAMDVIAVIHQFVGKDIGGVMLKQADMGAIRRELFQPLIDLFNHRIVVLKIFAQITAVRLMHGGENEIGIEVNRNVDAFHACCPL